MKNADSITFRCSSIGGLMTNGKTKAEPFGETCKTTMIDRFIQLQYGRRKEITNKYLEKGNAREEDSITLLSAVDGSFFKKNTVRLTNDFLTGEHDMHLGDFKFAEGPNGTFIMISPADETLDTKSSWSIHTFMNSANKKVDSDYFWQGQGYMALTGAKKHTVALCLVNGTDQAILDAKRKLQWKLGILDPSGQAQDSPFIKGCIEIEKNHIFDLRAFREEYPHMDLDSDTENWEFDIPMEKRVRRFTFERDQESINSIYQRVKDCRIWMNENL